MIQSVANLESIWNLGKIEMKTKQAIRNRDAATFKVFFINIQGKIEMNNRQSEIEMKLNRQSEIEAKSR